MVSPLVNLNFIALVGQLTLVDRPSANNDHSRGRPGHSLTHITYSSSRIPGSPRLLGNKAQDLELRYATLPGLIVSIVAALLW